MGTSDHQAGNAGDLNAVTPIISALLLGLLLVVAATVDASLMVEKQGNNETLLPLRPHSHRNSKYPMRRGSPHSSRTLKRVPQQ